jgi:outer membrane protein assembly factor BamB
MAMDDTFSDYDKYWPQWRGPQADGVALFGDPPLEWSETKNIRWKIEVPGNGHASPIIWQNKIFILTAIESEKKAEQSEQTQSQGEGRRRGSRGVKPSGIQKYSIMVFNRLNGELIWQRTAREEMPHEGIHPTGSWASSSGITDGNLVFAYFGSRGLYCYDMKGNLKWEKDFGDMRVRNSFGEGSSPALHDNKLIINWDHEDQSFIVALDKTSGREIWRVNRDEVSTWVTPFIVEHKNTQQVVIPGSNRVRSYDLSNGNLIWECSGLTSNPIPTPVHADGMVFVMTGHRGSALLAINLDEAKGDITNSKAIVWKYDKNTPYVPSPMLYKGNLYFFRSNSENISCLDAKTGEEYYSKLTLDGVEGIYASPVAVNNRIYIAGQNGATAVIKHGNELNILAVNSLEDRFDASPAIVGNELYLRGQKYLYCIASD